jgi:hypothetical protein
MKHSIKYLLFLVVMATLIGDGFSYNRGRQVVIRATKDITITINKGA